jgi:hypothetical protein
MTMNNLAIVLRYQAKFVEARPLIDHVLGVRQRTLGADHPLTLDAYENLGHLIEQPSGTGRGVFIRIP